MDEDLKSRYFIYLLSQFAKKSWSLFCILVSRTKIFRLMHNETLMNIVFPGFAIDFFLMAHDHFLHQLWSMELGSGAIGEPRFLSHGCFMTLWTCAVFWGVFLAGGNFIFLWLISCGWYFATDGCCIFYHCFLHGLLQASLNMAVIYCIQAILVKELCWFLQLKTKHYQCWCFSSGTEVTANSCCFIQPWDQNLP